jgi:hypothetical protein
MLVSARLAVLLLLTGALPGCAVGLYGNQTTTGGTTKTTTAAAVSGSAGFSGGKVAFSAGQVPPPGSPGGQVRASGNAGLVVIGIAAVAEFVNYFFGEPPPKPLPPDTRIAHTCSCYRNDSGEVTK